MESAFEDVPDLRPVWALAGLGGTQMPQGVGQAQGPAVGSKSGPVFGNLQSLNIEILTKISLDNLMGHGN